MYEPLIDIDRWNRIPQNVQLLLRDITPRTNSITWSMKRIRGVLEDYAAINDEDELRVFWFLAGVDVDAFGFDKLHGLQVRVEALMH